MDSRLSDTACRLGLYIAELGDDWIELAPDELAKVAHGFPSRDTLARHLRQLELAEYVERRPGGRGHSDRFRWSFSSREKPGPKTDSSEKKPGPKNDLGPGKNPELSDRSGKKPGPKPPHARDQAEKNDRTNDRENDAREQAQALEPRADELIERYSDKLTGCRNALRDYLAARVSERRQAAYVHTLACYFDDPAQAFRLPNGGFLPENERGHVVATALNELLQHGERVVEKPMRPMKWPDGDIRNLRTKIDILIQQRTDGPRRPRSPAPFGSEAAGVSDEMPGQHRTRTTNGLEAAGSSPTTEEAITDDDVARWVAENPDAAAELRREYSIEPGPNASDRMRTMMQQAANDRYRDAVKRQIRSERNHVGR